MKDERINRALAERESTIAKQARVIDRLKAYSEGLALGAATLRTEIALLKDRIARQGETIDKYQERIDELESEIVGEL